MHVMVYGELVETPQVEYAAKVASLLPGGLSSLYFVNSGAEAVEGALKLAKRYTGRTELVSMRRAYHGSTHGSMSMMGGSRRRGVERGFPAPAARRAGNRIQRFRGVRAHHAPHGMRPCRTRAGRSGRPPACPGLSGGAAAPLRRSRGTARIRRDTDRHGAHGSTVRHAQIRRYARHRVPGQGIRGAACRWGRSSRGRRLCKPCRRIPCWGT